MCQLYQIVTYFYCLLVFLAICLFFVCFKKPINWTLHVQSQNLQLLLAVVSFIKNKSGRVGCFLTGWVLLLLWLTENFMHSILLLEFPFLMDRVSVPISWMRCMFWNISEVWCYLTQIDFKWKEIYWKNIHILFMTDNA